MLTNKLPPLDVTRLQQIIATLTSHRLGKYLRTTHNDQRQALRLYAINAKISAAFLVDLHYLEIALRNKFDVELTAGFNSPQWYLDARFISFLDQRGQDILRKAQRDAAKGQSRGQPVPAGKVIAELMFGFWLNLTDPSLEHSLWVPYLHKAFLPRTPPRRSALNNSLEKLRQLRNRVAHHEPIFHMDLLGTHKILQDALSLLCPATARVMSETSLVKQEVIAMSRFRNRRKF